MLLKENVQSLTQAVFVMSDTDILAVTVRNALREIAKQASALGMGLQNAAPGDKGDTPNQSVQYLLGIAEEIAKAADDNDAFPSEL